jgi:hypothetical protein
MDRRDTVTITRLDRHLRSVERGLRSLPDIVAKRLEERKAGVESDDQLADRLAFQDEWWNLIDRLDALRSTYASGAMTEAQRQTFKALCPAILDALPQIRSLDLRPPTAETLDTAARVVGRKIVTRSA